MDLKDIRLDNLSKPVQHALLAGLVLCLAAVFYLYFMKDLIRERNALQDEKIKLETSVAKMTAVESQLKEFEQELSQLNKYLTNLRSILPAQKETPTVLRSVQHMAVSSNLKILKFSPKPTIARDFYSDWPIDIEVEGNYDGLGTFFEKIGAATRIIDVGTISIQNIEGSTDPKLTLKARCTATTFVYKENQPDPAGDNASGAKENTP